MPKNAYKSFYYYLVKEYDDNSLDTLVNEKRYRTIQDIRNDYNISRTNIFYKITGNKEVKKLQNLVILKDKVPAFEIREIEY